MENLDRGKFTTFKEEEEASPYRPGIYQSEKNALKTTHEQHLVRAYLDSLDQKQLFSIFCYHFQKSGNALETINYIPLRKVQILEYIDNMRSCYGRNKLGDCHISLNAQMLADNPVNCVFAVVHEELHALVDAGDMGHVPPGGLVRSGFERARATINQSLDSPLLDSEIYTSADEGFTEYLTFKISEEYFEATKDSSWYGEDNIADAKEVMFASDYASFTIRVKAYMRLIHFLTGVEPEVIEGAMIRAYFRNSPIIPNEVVEVLNEIHPELLEKVHQLLNNPDPDYDGLQVFQLVEMSLDKRDYLKQKQLDQLIIETAKERGDYILRRKKYRDKHPEKFPQKNDSDSIAA